MALRAGSPTRGQSPAQSRSEQPEPPKQFVKLSKLDSKEKPFRYLDFAEGGANAALNKWGQFLQFSRLVLGGGDPDTWHYISVEPRDIFQLEYIAPEQKEDEDVCWERDHWYPRRHNKFNALCMQDQGFGLRFLDNTNISEPEHYYRNDRWPEVRYTVEGRVKVVLQHYIQDGEIIQDMCLTSESAEETELNLEFEFTTGIRIAPGSMRELKEADALKHSLQLVAEEEAPESHWKIWCGSYYVTASLFKDGKPKPFSFLGDGKQKNMPEWDIDILSDDPIRYRETFTLRSKAKVKFTSVFKLDHENTPNNTLPHYFDISPHLELFDGRWWAFKTESSSFIFRRNLETILSHAMPLPWIEDENYQPYVMHDHDLINTFQSWSNSLNQALYLLEIDKVLQQQDTADQITKSHYRERIQKVIFGYFVWLLRHAERNGFAEEEVILHWSGKQNEVPDEPTEEPFEAEAVEPPVRPLEPELSKYEDRFRNCCQFLVLLDMCLTNYPDEAALFTRLVEAFLKLAWEPIEMSKHQGSHLWPDQLDLWGVSPSPYARSQARGDHEGPVYDGHGVYVYSITTQVLVWRATKSAKRLLNLVSNNQSWNKWMAHQSLNYEAIRDRTIEVFRPPNTDTGHDYFPDRFLSKIKGHIRESFLNRWSCDTIIPSFVEDFFFDDNNEPMLAWTETLRNYVFNDSTKAQKPDIWESFLCYQLAIDRDRRQVLRESFESNAYSVGLFAGDVITPGSRCPYTTSWAMAAYFLSADHTELLYPQFRILMNIDHPTHADRIQGPILPQEGLMNAGINPSTSVGARVRQDRRKPRQKGRSVDITAEDRSQVNDPPSYGEWYWFREPLFMKDKPKKFEMNRKFIERLLEPEINWSYFWETSQAKDDFLKNMADMSNYKWGNGWNVLVQPSRNGEHSFFQGNAALLKLGTQRDKKVDKKRILLMEDCMIEHLITLMANIDFQEVHHIGEFLSRLRLMDPHEMRFAEQTIMPDNLWITEFNINFIMAPPPAGVESSLPPNYFPKKHDRFQSINDAVSGPIMAEAAMGFRIIGDLHDRYWTCYVFYDFGIHKLSEDTRKEVEKSNINNSSSSQRKCLEGLLVRQALDLVLSETKIILHIIDKSMGEGKEKSQTLFNPLLTEDDLSEENYFKTVNKNSVFYPWLLEVFGALHGRCTESRSVAEQWISAEKTRKYKPRWTERDQKNFGDEVAKNRVEVKTRCTKLEKMAKNLQERIDRIKTLKASLSSELALREARTSTHLAQTVNLFAVVTTIYLPLTFSTSIVAIQDFHWSSPAKALVKITLAVTFGTLILLMNLALLRRNLAVLKTWAQRSIRQRMAGAPESPHAHECKTPSPNSPSQGPSKKPAYQEKHPGWKYWKERARGLREAEKRSTLLTDNAVHDSESAWWYWYFMMIFIIIVVPVQELTFIIRTLRLQKIENSGPLKKLVRIPWAPIWILQLAFVYAIILIGHALLSLVGLVHRTAVWLWTGNNIAEAKKVESGGNKKESEEDEKGSEPESTREDRGPFDWWMRPAKTMQFFIVAEALQSEKKAEGADLEKQEPTVETTEVPPPS